MPLLKRFLTLLFTLAAASAQSQDAMTIQRPATPSQTPVAAHAPRAAKPSASSARPAQANAVLGFDDFNCLEVIGDYYAGGRGGSGTGPGPGFGISFSSNAIVLWDYFVYPLCGSDNVSHTANFPSEPNGVFFLEGTAATMNVPAGFSGGFSFYYAAPFNPGAIRVWSGVNGQGTLLTSLDLPLTAGCNENPAYCVWVPIGVSFNGVAKSVDFGGSANRIVFDNITLGASLTGTTQPAKTSGNTSNQPNCPCNAAGDPISISTGNLYESVTDYQTAGLNPLAFIRSYNSSTDTTTVANSLGKNWRSNFDRYLTISAFAASLERADGQRLNFAQRGSAWITDSDIDLQLTKSNTTWTLTDSDDNIETYSSVTTNLAVLVSVQRRNGYIQRLQRDSTGQLMAVTDSYGRKLQFNYQNNTLQSVTTVDGGSISYGYDGSNRLASVTYPTDPPTTQTYLYENASFPNALTGILDENGNRYTSWTYDSQGRAITSQHGDGAALTTIVYNDADGTRTVTNALGLTYIYRLAALQNMSKVIQVDRQATGSVSAATMKFTYDNNGFVASKTDWNGTVTTYQNDPRGQPVSIVEASGTPRARTTTIMYHPTLHLPTKIVKPGLSTALTYDPNGNLTSKTETDIAGTN